MSFFGAAFFLAALLCSGASQARPVIEADREQEIEALFSGVGVDCLPHWKVAGIEIPEDRIVVKLESPALETLSVELRFRSGDSAAIAQTPSFEVFLSPGTLTETPTARPAAVEVARCVAARDDGHFWRASATGDSGEPGLLWWLAWSLLITLVLIGLRTRAGAAWLAAVDNLVEHRAAWFLLALLAPIAVIQLVHLNLPFDADACTQRIFFASQGWGEILSHAYRDERHPQLFYLILHMFLWAGHSEAVARLPAVIFSLTAVSSLFLLARPILGASRALLAAALLEFSAPFLDHSRDVSDVTLFLTLALLSCHLFLQCLRAPNRIRLVLFALAETAMFYSYFMAPLVGFAQGITLVLHGRSRKFSGLWLAAAAVLIAALPALRDFILVFIHDVGIRTLAGQYPQHLWGAREPLSFGREVIGLLLPPGWMGWIAGGLGLAGVWRFARRSFRQPEGTLLFGMVAAALAVVFVGVFWVRLKPYYVIILLPLFSMLLTAGGLGPGPDRSPDPKPEPPPEAKAGARFRWLAVFAARLLLALAALAVVGNTVASLPGIYSPQGHDQYVKLAEEVQAEGGADLVVGDPDCMHTILIYYLFLDPIGMYRRCRFTDDLPVNCTVGSQRLVNLTAMSRMAPGWEQRSVQRLRELAAERFWFAYNSHFENRDLKQLLDSTCSLRGTWEFLSLYRCGPRPP